VIFTKKTDNILNKWEIQHNVLNRVIAICGDIERLSKLLGLDK